MTSTLYCVLPRPNIQPLFYVFLSIKKCIHVHIVINPPKQKIQLLKEIYYRYLGYSIRITVRMTCEKFACNNSIQVLNIKQRYFPLFKINYRYLPRKTIKNKSNLTKKFYLKTHQHFFYEIAGLSRGEGGELKFQLLATKTGITYCHYIILLLYNLNLALQAVVKSRLPTHKPTQFGYLHLVLYSRY